MQRAEPIHVVAAVIENKAKEVLISRRHDHVHQGGKWEFPGGKVEHGETARDALARELNEELGITVADAVPLINVPYRYPDKEVLLEVWCVRHYLGNPTGREGQVISWTSPHGLTTSEFPAANQAVVAALLYPEFYGISSMQLYGETEFLRKLERALEQGLRLLQLREHHLDKSEYLSLAEKVVSLCHRHHARVLLNCDPVWLADSDADGLHLTERRLLSLDRRPVEAPLLVSCSCHDERALKHAEKIGADFVVLSPVNLTGSHPRAKPIGWNGFRKLRKGVALPVYALGGLGFTDLERARQQGAQGVAMIRGLWESVV